MNKGLLFFLILLSQVAVAQAPDHTVWDQLVRKNVLPDGKVNYKGFIAEKGKLQEYLDLISRRAPDPATWSRNEQLAYWINAYNAFTVKLIVDHYPVKSIQDLQPRLKIPGANTIWHEKFFRIGGKESSLDELEHSILRKQFDEPRIHFAINCASVSCPVLLNEAFVPTRLEQQLQRQAIRFINDPARNKISRTEAKLSQVFNWFAKDFIKKGTLIDFINQYSTIKVDKKATISFIEYDWSLNE